MKDAPSSFVSANIGISKLRYYYQKIYKPFRVIIRNEILYIRNYLYNK